jgi:hypothetical protein
VSNRGLWNAGRRGDPTGCLEILLVEYGSLNEGDRRRARDLAAVLPFAKDELREIVAAVLKEPTQLDDSRQPGQGARRSVQ